MLSSLYFSFLLVAASQVALAQSYNCANATQPAEKLVCNDPALQKMDVRLKQVYRHAVAKLPTQETKYQLQQDEQLWLKERFNQCPTANCLSTAYQERIAYLETYSVEPVSSKALTYTVEPWQAATGLTLPQLRSAPVMTHGAKQFNNMVRALVSPTEKMFGKYEATIQQNKLVVAYISLATDTGGVHPQPSRISYVFDLEHSELIPLSRLFKPHTEYLTLLAEFARAQLSKQVADGMWNGDAETVAKGTEPKPENFEHYTLTPDALVLHFPPYQVGPYSDGDATVTIPASALREVLDPAGPLGKTPSAESR